MQSVCENFHRRPNINPRTGRSIKIGGPTYRKLLVECESNSLPEFMPPTDLACEGYWDKTYTPTPSPSRWDQKDVWLNKVHVVEADLAAKPDPVEIFPMDLTKEERSDRRVQGRWVSRGLSPSRIDPNEVVSNDEYEDNGMCWPGGYVDHYIEEHNVMPTKRFHDYINARFATLQNQ